MSRKLERGYRGVTYPQFLIRWEWQRKIWQRLFCSREMHLFDEVLSFAEKPYPHYLHCDACQLIVHIERFDEDFIAKETP